MLLKNQDEEQPQPVDEGESEERTLRFRVAYVFDISQTEGEDFPDLSKTAGDPGDFLHRLRGLVEDLDIALEYREDLGGADGLSSGGLIAIKSGLSPAEESSTLTHEIAHEWLHKGEKRAEKTKQSRELEAEGRSVRRLPKNRARRRNREFRLHPVLPRIERKPRRLARCNPVRLHDDPQGPF